MGPADVTIRDVDDFEPRTGERSVLAFAGRQQIDEPV